MESVLYDPDPVILPLGKHYLILISSMIRIQEFQVNKPKQNTVDRFSCPTYHQYSFLQRGTCKLTMVKAAFGSSTGKIQIQNTKF